MPVFLVTPLANNAAQIGGAIRAQLPPEAAHELQNTAGWLVSYSGTTIELSNIIGITSADKAIRPSLGAAMVTSIGSYYGLAATSTWEWLKTRFESQ